MSFVAKHSINDISLIQCLNVKATDNSAAKFFVYGIMAKNLPDFEQLLAIDVEAALMKYCIIIQQGEGDSSNVNWQDLAEYGLSPEHISLFAKEKKFTDMI